MTFTYLAAILKSLTKVTIILGLIGLSGCLSSKSLVEGLARSPHHPVQDSERYHSLNSFQQDFLYLTEIVRETHPDPYTAWSKQEFDDEQHRILTHLAAETSKTAFEQSLQTFLVRLQDSHTGAQISGGSLGPIQYPISFFWLKDTLVLASVGKQEDTTLIGSRVLSFNDISTQEVFTRFKRFIAYDNIYRARRTLQYYFVFPNLHHDAGIIVSDTLELTLLTPSGSTSRFLVLPVPHPVRYQHYQPPSNTPAPNKLFSYTFIEGDKVCSMQFNSMNDLRRARLLPFPMNLLAYPAAWYYGIGYFDNFLEDMFQEMKEKYTTALIVDLRANGGGSTVYGEQLLYHLDVSPDIRNYSMGIRFSPLFRESYPEMYDEYADSYAKKYGGKKLPDSLIMASDINQQDPSGSNYFRNITDPNSSYYIKPNRTVFKGQVYFLVGEGTFSSAVILSTIVKDNKLFTIVGQPTGLRPSHFGDILSLRLPNSGIICTISYKHFFRPDTSKNYEDALYPDVETWRTYEDYKNRRNPTLDWILSDLKAKAK